MQPDAPRRRKSNAGFTRLELLTLLASLVVLAVVSRPVWGNPSATASLVCMDNLRQLQTAWLLYTEDTQGELPGNYHGGYVPGANPKARPWVTGWLDWGTASDNTNRLYLAKPYASLTAYLQTDFMHSTYKCPADDYLSPAQTARGWTARVRSYAMNCFLGEGNQNTGPLNSAYLIYRKLSEFRKASPQQVFVFLEEHPDSINDGLFWAPNSDRNWVDLPGSFHKGACWFTFADGHLEQRRWVSAATLRPVNLQYANNTSTQPGDPDLTWLLEHVGEKKR